jgi:chromosome segregation ATPase
MGNLHKEAENRIRNLQERYFQLTKECNLLTEQIRNITKTLEGINIDNPRLNKEINIIHKELYPYEQRLNKTWNPNYENEDWKDFQIIYLDIIKVIVKNLKKNIKLQKLV